MSTSGRASRHLLIFLLVVAMLMPACKDAENLDDLIGPGIPRPEAAFVPDAVPGGTTSDFVTLEVSSMNGNRITLDVVVTDVSTPISAIAIKMTYPSGLSTFVGCSDGNLFPPDNCLAAENPTGEVVVSRSITAPTSPVSVVGSAIIVQLHFMLTSFGSGPIVFEAQNLTGGDSTALLDGSGNAIFVSWFEGEIQGS